MAQKLTDRIIKNLPNPPNGNKVHYDSEVKGLGLRVTAAGAKSFVFNYRIKGRERRLTIGPYGKDQWTLVRARKHAGELRQMVDKGEDPLAERIEARTAPSVANLCERFIDEHFPKLRPATQKEYRAIIDKRILPTMKNLKVAEVTFTDTDGLHRKITKAGAPVVANRTAAVLSKMFSLAVKWRWRLDNPAKGIERNQEQKRTRYLTGDEFERLTNALAEHRNQQAANIVRLLILTGARSAEVRGMRWADVDLEAGIWTKPGATTKQKTEHRVPLSAPARQLLSELRKAADEDAVFVFPSGSSASGHRAEIKQNWTDLCQAAGITGARIHDLRHSYASVLASSGLSLPIIGALLGHTQPATTARYAHLFDDPLREATERVGAIVTGKPSAKIVKLNKGA